MSRPQDTSIRITKELRDELKERKRPKESYEAYIWRVLDQQPRPRREPVATPQPTPSPPADELEIKPDVDDDRDEPDLIAWVREHQPVSRKEIVENCVPDDYPNKADSWWQRHGRPVLKAWDTATYTNGVGWTIEPE